MAIKEYYKGFVCTPGYGFSRLSIIILLKSLLNVKINAVNGRLNIFYVEFGSNLKNKKMESDRYLAIYKRTLS